MLQARGLAKRYRSATEHGKACGVVGLEGEGVSFEVGRGEIFGVIGPDGAGKTTLIRILATLIAPDRGEASIDGLDLVRDFRHLRHHIGYMPGTFSLYPDLSIEENIRFFATLFHTTIRANSESIRNIYSQLAPFRSRKAHALSGGMKQKLALCCALIHRPKLLLLDEPTTGVDPVSRAELWDTLAELADKGVTIIASTAYMDEATRCHRIALMKEGGFLMVDSPTGITERFNLPLYQATSSNLNALIRAIRSLDPKPVRAVPFGDAYHLTFPKHTPLQRVAQGLQVAGCADASVSPISPSIEDCFMLFANDDE